MYMGQRKLWLCEHLKIQASQLPGYQPGEFLNLVGICVGGNLSFPHCH